MFNFLKGHFYPFQDTIARNDVLSYTARNIIPSRARHTNVTTCAMWTNHCALISGAQKSIVPQSSETVKNLITVLGSRPSSETIPNFLGYLHYNGKKFLSQ